MRDIEVDPKRNIFEGKPPILKIGFVDHYNRPYNWSFGVAARDEYWTVSELAWIADLAKTATAEDFKGLDCNGGDDYLCYSDSDLKTDYMIPKADK